MQVLSPKTIASTIAAYREEVASCKDDASIQVNPQISILSLKRIKGDLPLLLSNLNQHKNNSIYQSTFNQISTLSIEVGELLHMKQKEVKDFDKQFETTISKDTEITEQPPAAAETLTDDYASLRKRLLADGTSTSLDKSTTGTEDMNQYHENFQEELYSDLTDLASALKTSALSLSSKILDDSKLLNTTNENMLKSSSLMHTVGANLNGYLSEKSNGKISLFFLIKTMVFIFLLTAIMIILIKILPKM
ncbi:putative transport protein [Clavispora lusitaniae]|uniref:Transport protein n=1 Tax=Clavispora lusitaniae TaxID=36911 RepID=A0ACD0WMI9_CLALS|nr:putative transport protein [Clavispora lusitaniae]QFZ34214.1 putative transport protein [Clavispora lusitaniae]QFZ39898.1 putative transport protein [Clavispora lusitaniae]QFZ45580.1 putative transport protein [Clavispora lusitaniae]QFZ51244.1 putative transport protein [Clavispora lusitaniae]